MQVDELARFYCLIKEDNRITTTHISLYMALFQFRNQENCHGPIRISKHIVMETAKISGIATFHKCIKDLHEFGYIQYLPSKNPCSPSQVWLVEL